jgi:hypothetical protein
MTRLMARRSNLCLQGAIHRARVCQLFSLWRMPLSCSCCGAIRSTKLLACCGDCSALTPTPPADGQKKGTIVPGLGLAC